MNNKNKKIPERTDGIDLLSILLVLFKYWKFILIFSAGAVALVLFFMTVTAILPAQSSPLPDVYRASAVISLNQRVYSDVLNSVFSPVMSDVATSELGTSLLGFSYGEYVMRLIRSNVVLDRLALEFKIAERYGTDERRSARARGALLSRLILDYDEKTLMITVSYEEYDPAFAAKITNRLLELLAERILELKQTRSGYQKDLLAKKLDELETGLNELEVKIKQLQAKYGVIEVEKLSDEKVNLLANLRSQLVLKEMELRSYANSSQIEDPVLKKMRSERDILSQLIREIEVGTSRTRDSLPGQTLLSEIVLEFAHLEREYRIQEKIYEILLQEFEITKIRLSLVGEEPIFQVIEAADVPDTKWGPNRTILTITLTVGAFLFCCLGVLIYNALRQRNLIKEIKLRHLFRK